MDFIGSDFSVESATPLGVAIVRLRYTQDPRKLSDGDPTDALTISNYVISGPSTNNVIGASEVYSDPQSVDLYFEAPLVVGSWTITVSNVQEDGAQPLDGPVSVQFAVTTLVTLESVNKGAVNDAAENIVRKYLNPALVGAGWNSMLAALAAALSINWDNAKLALPQTTLSTSSGIYLERNASNYGITKPKNIGMDDDAFRQFAIIAKNEQLTQGSILDILEVFYGADTVRANIDTYNVEPYYLQDGFELKLLIDGTEVAFTFSTSEFTAIGQAKAMEVAASITRTLADIGSQAYAVAYRDPTIDRMRVRVYSGSKGLAGSLSVIGGQAQTSLQFPHDVYQDLSWAGTTWTTSLVGSGLVRFTPNTGLDLSLLHAGDLVYIYGTEFASLPQYQNYIGTFTVQDTSSYYDGATLVQSFDMLAPGISLTQAVTQYDIGSLKFFRPVKRVSYDNIQKLTLSQTGTQARLVLPATSAITKRNNNTAAYNQLNQALSIDTVVRNGNTVTVTTDTSHGLLPGNQVTIDSVTPFVSIDVNGKLPPPPVVAGTPSSGGTLIGTTDRAVMTHCSSTFTMSGLYNKAITLKNTQAMIVGGVKEAADVATANNAVWILGVTSDTTDSDGRQIGYAFQRPTISGYIATTIGSYLFGSVLLSDGRVMLRGGFGCSGNAFVPIATPTDNLIYHDSLTNSFEEVLRGGQPGAAGHTLVQTHNNTVYALGGATYWNMPTANISTNILIASLAEARQEHTSLLLSNGNILSIGGRSPSPTIEDDDTMAYYWNFTQQTENYITDTLVDPYTTRMYRDQTTYDAPNQIAGQSGLAVRTLDSNISTLAVDSRLTELMSGEYSIEWWSTLAGGCMIEMCGPSTLYSANKTLLRVFIRGGYFCWARTEASSGQPFGTIYQCSQTLSTWGIVLDADHPISGLNTYYMCTLTFTNSHTPDCFDVSFCLNGVEMETWRAVPAAISEPTSILNIGKDSTDVSEPASPYFSISGLIASWDASSLDSTLSHGDLVPTLTDLTGNGHNLTQPDSFKPNLYKNAHNGHSALALGGSQCMYNTSITGVGDTWTAFVAYQNLDTGFLYGIHSLMDFQDSFGAQSSIYINSGNGLWKAQTLGGGAYPPLATGSVDNGAWHFAVISCSPSGISMSVDGSSILSTSYPFLVSMNAFMLGANGGFMNNGWKGYISEVSIKAGAATAQDLTDWSTHCTNQYGGGGGLGGPVSPYSVGQADFAINELRLYKKPVTDNSQTLDRWNMQKGVTVYSLTDATVPQFPIGRVLNSCEVFRPDTLSSVLTGNMTDARFDFGTVILPDGRIIVIGGIGYNPSNSTDAQPLSSCEIYDPSIEAWHRLPSMQDARQKPVVQYIASKNAVYVFGGSNTTSIEILDVETMKWSISASSLTEPLYMTTPAYVGNDVMVGLGTRVLTPDVAWSTSSDGGIVIVGDDSIWSGGMNKQATVATVLSPTQFTYQSDISSHTTSGGEPSAIPVGSKPSSIVGPYVYDTKEGVSLTSVIATVDIPLIKGNSYGTITLLGTIMIPAPARAFPDSTGYLCFGLGTDTQVVVKYFGVASDTELVLDLGYLFPTTITSGTEVVLLSKNNPYIPSTVKEGDFWLTDSAAARATAISTVDTSFAAGLDLVTTITYPGGRGLGGESFPNSGSYKISDVVAVWADNEIDKEVEAAKNE